MRQQSSWIPRLAAISGPKHEQLATALAQDIAECLVPPGARLPPHRDLAYRLSIGLGTVTRAYGLLEKRGLVKSQHGRGMFVVGSEPARQQKRIDLSINTPPQILADRLLAATFQSLPHFIDSEAFRQYRPAIGSLSHRRSIAHWLGDNRFQVSPDHLFLTNGAQHALSVAVGMLIDNNGSDCLFAESLTYPGMLAIARYTGIPLVPVELDEEGMRPDALDRALASHGKNKRRCAIYLTPTLHNPTTATMGLQRRKDIVATCRAHGAYLIEDDVYSIFSSRALPSLAELAPERTIYVGGFSKVLSPGLRIGFLVTPPSLCEAAWVGLQATAAMISPLSCGIIERWIVDGTASSIANSMIVEAAYRTRLARSILPEIAQLNDECALHAWLPMHPVDAERLTHYLAKEQVAVTPPSSVMVNPRDETSGIRLCLGGPTHTELAQALSVIRKLIDQDMDRSPSRSVAI